MVRNGSEAAGRQNREDLIGSKALDFGLFLSPDAPGKQPLER